MHNERTYPNLLRLFDELGVETQESDMSMSVRSDDHRLEWAGALGFAGLFPTWRNALRPSYLRMLTEIPRFHRQARKLLAAPETDGDADQTLATFLDRGGFSPLFRTHFMESLVACVWSCDPAVALDYPARYLFTLPPAPRDAADLRLAAVAHRHRRLAGVRREGGRPAPRRAHRHQGDLGARDARRAWR